MDFFDDLGAAYDSSLYGGDLLAYQGGDCAAFYSGGGAGSMWAADAWDGAGLDPGWVAGWDAGAGGAWDGRHWDAGQGAAWEGRGWDGGEVGGWSSLGSLLEHASQHAFGAWGGGGGRYARPPRPRGASSGRAGSRPRQPYEGPRRRSGPARFASPRRAEHRPARPAGRQPAEARPAQRRRLNPPPHQPAPPEEPVVEVDPTHLSGAYRDLLAQFEATGRVTRAAYRRIMARHGCHLQSDQDVSHIIAEAVGGVDHPDNFCVLGGGVNRSLQHRGDHVMCFLVGLEKARKAVAACRLYGWYDGASADSLYEDGRQAMQRVLAPTQQGGRR